LAHPVHTDAHILLVTVMICHERNKSPERVTTKRSRKALSIRFSRAQHTRKQTQYINQSIKKRLYSAVCRERNRGVS